MNPAEQRRAPGTGQYYADYAPITNQGGRSGPNRPPDIPQVPAAMQEYPDYPGNKNNEEVAILWRKQYGNHTHHHLEETTRHHLEETKWELGTNK